MPKDETKTPEQPTNAPESGSAVPFEVNYLRDPIPEGTVVIIPISVPDDEAAEESHYHGGIRLKALFVEAEKLRQHGHKVVFLLADGLHRHNFKEAFRTSPDITEAAVEQLALQHAEQIGQDYLSRARKASLFEGYSKENGNLYHWEEWKALHQNEYTEQLAQIKTLYTKPKSSLKAAVANTWKTFRKNNQDNNKSLNQEDATQYILEECAVVRTFSLLAHNSPHNNKPLAVHYVYPATATQALRFLESPAAKMPSQTPAKFIQCAIQPLATPDITMKRIVKAFELEHPDKKNKQGKNPKNLLDWTLSSHFQALTTHLKLIVDFFQTYGAEHQLKRKLAKKIFPSLKLTFTNIEDASFPKPNSNETSSSTENQTQKNRKQKDLAKSCFITIFIDPIITVIEAYHDLETTKAFADALLKIFLAQGCIDTVSYKHM